MNLVIDEAVEVKQITKTNDKEERKNLGTQLLLLLGAVDLTRANPAPGQILLKGDNVSLIQSLSG